MSRFYRTNKGRGADETSTPPAKPPPEDMRTSGTYDREHPPPGPSPSNTNAPEVRRPSIDDIIDEHEDYVWSIIARNGMQADAGEIEADVFYAVETMLQNGDTLAETRSVLATITHRRIHDRQRDLVRERARASDVDADTLPDSQPDLDAVIDAKRAAEAVFAEMKPAEATLVRDFDFVGVRRDENLSSTLRSRLTRARQSFAVLVDRLYGDKKGGDE